MITVHNLQGDEIAINGSLVERVDGGPETHVMLVNGTSYIVKESIEEVVLLHREDRALVQAMAARLPDGSPEARPAPAHDAAGRDGGLRLVVPHGDEHEEPAP